jgi:polygalacturonase
MKPKLLSRKEFLSTGAKYAAGITAGIGALNFVPQGRICPAITDSSSSWLFETDASHRGVYNVRDFGASGTAALFDTEPVQNAIDNAHENGGGIVFFPAGKYLIRTIVLKDNVSLYLTNGAIILGGTDLNRFDEKYGSFTDSQGRRFGTALIFALNAKNISIEGNGTIDGQGYEEHYPRQEGVARPYIIRFIRCRFVKVQDITLVNSAAWVQHYVECEDLLIDGIRVDSFSNKNNDGLNIEGCRRVTVTRCNINSEDDSIVLKTLTANPCRDIVISDCIIGGLKSAIKIGTESIGDFENITITNCTIYGTRGISLLAVDGGSINNVTISNISMRDTYAVIVVRLGARMNPYSVDENKRPARPGTIKNIMINGIQAIGVTEINDFIAGIPEQAIENISMNNISIGYRGGGTKEDAQRDIPELIDEYPKAKMFGTLPSYGFFIRHVRNISFHDIRLDFDTDDARPALYCDRVENLELDRIHARSIEDADTLFRFNDVSDAVVRYCRIVGSARAFIELRGGKTKNIVLDRNNSIGAEELIRIHDTVSPDEVTVY